MPDDPMALFRALERHAMKEAPGVAREEIFRRVIHRVAEENREEIALIVARIGDAVNPEMGLVSMIGLEVVYVALGRGLSLIEPGHQALGEQLQAAVNTYAHELLDYHQKLGREENSDDHEL